MTANTHTAHRAVGARPFSAVRGLVRPKLDERSARRAIAAQLASQPEVQDAAVVVLPVRGGTALLWWA